MRTTLIVAAVALCAALAGCGGGGDQPATSASSTATSGASSDQYAETVIASFRDAYAASGGRGDGDPADWTAFVRVIEDLDPPKGEEMNHEQMVAGFQAYVDALKDLEDTCAEHPGPGGPCYTAASKAGDAWEAALDRAYEVPGLSYARLLGG